jgi:hypothetical protein
LERGTLKMSDTPIDLGLDDPTLDSDLEDEEDEDFPDEDEDFLSATPEEDQPMPEDIDGNH